MQIPLFIATTSGAKLAAKELGARYDVDVVIIDWAPPEKENAEEQAATIDRFSLSRVDGIAVSCSNSNSLSAAIDKAVKKGIPVMCFNTDAPLSSRFAYYGANDIEFGRMLMRGLANELNEKGTIAVLAGNKNGLYLQRRLLGIKEELKKYPAIVLPQENIIYNLDIPVIASEAINRTQKTNPNIKGWILINSAALQVKNGIKWNPGDVKIVAGNAVPYELENVKSGHVQSLVGVNCFQIGYKSVEILLEKIIRKKTPNEPVMYCQLTMVNEKNVNEWSANWNKWMLKETLK